MTDYAIIIQIFRIQLLNNLIFNRIFDQRNVWWKSSSKLIYLEFVTKLALFPQPDRRIDSPLKLSSTKFSSSLKRFSVILEEPESWMRMEVYKRISYWTFDKSFLLERRQKRWSNYWYSTAMRAIRSQKRMKGMEKSIFHSNSTPKNAFPCFTAKEHRASSPSKVIKENFRMKEEFSITHPALAIW